jgi:putative restriction endonuclease
MNLLQRALIEKAGHDNGFEHVLPTAVEGWLALGSARHPAEVAVQTSGGGFAAALTRCQPSLPGELTRSFPESIQARGPMGALFVLPTEDALARWLRRTAALAQALPDQAVTNFDAQVQAALAELEPGAAKSTEVLRLVRQRVGQQAFRHAMLDYWGGACAVTSVALPQVLRASHAKAWALCDSDAERLDVYNGFLLSANLDALFDTYLVTFDGTGTLQISELVSDVERSRLGLSNGMKLRWLDEKHQRYLEFQRSKCTWFSG